MSARLSVRAISHLVKKSQAQTIITSERSAPLIEEVQLESGDSKLQVHFARPYRYFLIQHTISKPIPYEDICCREVDADDCGALIFHSSGTTGLPKPIYLAQAYPLGYAACHLFAADRVDAINVTTLPLYHVRTNITVAAICPNKCPGIWPPRSVLVAFDRANMLFPKPINCAYCRIDDSIIEAGKCKVVDDGAIHCGRFVAYAGVGSNRHLEEPRLRRSRWGTNQNSHWRSVCCCRSSPCESLWCDGDWSDCSYICS